MLGVFFGTQFGHFLTEGNENVGGGGSPAADPTDTTTRETVVVPNEEKVVATNDGDASGQPVENLAPSEEVVGEVANVTDDTLPLADDGVEEPVADAHTAEAGNPASAPAAEEQSTSPDAGT
jgi:hypothetical protein